ncbi:hypothetical protein ASZ78_015720 [Callipepla squamata]|uniref:FAS1 domain-containing protein n=1 Tax=Callipepla squamata TaxID=9009 RepID=A0A226NPS6_CALSU|nr:hypothetical protein ASZ78_015720 [Callipepla squamata]
MKLHLTSQVPDQTKKRCDQKLLVQMKTECMPCSLNLEARCPAGYTKITNGTGIPDCRKDFLGQPVKNVLKKICLVLSAHQFATVFMEYATVELQEMEDAPACLDTKGSAVINLSIHALKKSVILMPTALTLDRINTNVLVKKVTEIKELLNNNLKAQYFVKLHVIAGQLNTTSLNNTDTIHTLTGKSGEISRGEKDNQLRIRIQGGRRKGKLLQGNIIASNGILHIVDKAMDNMEPAFQSNKEETIMSVLQDNGRYSQFASLIEKTGLGMDLQQDNRLYTVFVPSNDALSNMKSEDLDYLLSAEGSLKLLELVRYHIVSNAELEIASLISVGHIRSMAKQFLFFNTTSTGQVLVSGEEMEETDIVAKNGRIFTLSGVLIPPTIVPILPHRCDETKSQTVMIPSQSNQGVAEASLAPAAVPAQEVSPNPAQETDSCICKAGYEGDGMTCSKVDPCAGLNSGGCNIHATCQLEPSYGWECVCPKGYEGDGRICYGNAADEAELNSVLSTASNLTVLVPSLQAIENMDEDEKDFWMSKSNIPTLLKYHLLTGAYSFADFQNLSSSDMLPTSLQSNFLHLSKENGNLTVEGAHILTGDIASTNGIIHVIDKVLTPLRSTIMPRLLARLEQMPDYSIFRGYIIQYGLADEIEAANTYTVFAPNNDAVENYLRDKKVVTLDEDQIRYHILIDEKLLKSDLHNGMHRETMLGYTYHVGFFLHNSQLFVNDAPISYANVATDKGIIHGLGKVLEIQKNRCDTNHTVITVSSSVHTDSSRLIRDIWSKCG